MSCINTFVEGLERRFPSEDSDSQEVDTNWESHDLKDFAGYALAKAMVVVAKSSRYLKRALNHLSTETEMAFQLNSVTRNCGNYSYIEAEDVEAKVAF